MNPGIEAVVVAGRSTVEPASNAIPNCLMQVGGRPVLDYWVKSLAEARISTAWVISHAHAKGMQEYIEANNAAFQLCLVESHGLELPAVASTLAAHGAPADDADVIVILNGASLTDIDLRPLIAFHCQHGDPFTMVLLQRQGSCGGIVDLDAQGRIVSFTDKANRSTGSLVDAGLYVMDAQAFGEIATMGALI